MENQLQILSDENIEEELTEKEKKLLNKILEEYEFKIINCKKIKNEYKIETEEEIICLKKVYNKNFKPFNIISLVEDLVGKNFLNTEKYYKTRQGNAFVKYKKIYFYVVKWIDGKICNLNNLNEAVNCSKLLAKFHLSTKDSGIKKIRLKNNIKNWPKIFNESLLDFERFQKIIDKKRMKTEFDIAYYNHIEIMNYRGIIALNILNTSEYYKLWKNAEKNKTLCHNKFYYKNVLKKDENYYVLNLDNAVIDIHVNDLAKLIKSLMMKVNYKWDFNKAKIIIEAYNSINKLNKNELEVMLSLIVFPYKFWKLGKRRYVKHKSWDEMKYIRKLNRITKYEKMQDEFIQNYISYLKYYV